MAGDAFLDLLRREPVRHENVFAALPVVKDVKGILAVRGVNDALDRESGIARFELLELTRGQIETIRKNQPVLFREQNTGLDDRIDADDLLEFLIENKTANGPFLIG